VASAESNGVVWREDPKAVAAVAYLVYMQLKLA